MRKFVLYPFNRRMKCDTDACGNRATASLGRSGSHPRRRQAFCDACLREFGMTIIDHFHEDKDFVTGASEAFGNKNIAKGTPVSDIATDNKRLAAENELLQAQLEEYKQANEELAAWKEEQAEKKREAARKQRQRAKEG